MMISEQGKSNFFLDFLINFPKEGQQKKLSIPI